MIITAANAAPARPQPVGLAPTLTTADPAETAETVAPIDSGDWPALRRKPRPEPAACHLRSTLTLRGGVTTVGTVVAFVDRQLCPAHSAMALGPVMLLATELGMHAVRRVSRTSLLTAECHVGRIELVVEVPGVRVASFGPRARNPLGLALIGRIADDWGIEPRGRGVRIWAAVDTVRPTWEDTAVPGGIPRPRRPD